jgi:pantoate--beta-alanine ligase
MALRAGNDDYVALCATASAQLLAVGFDAVDYIVVCDAQTLEVVESSDRPGSVLPSHQSKVILAVARLGKTRLLDNVLV